MSTIHANKIKEKIIQRRGNELLAQLDGLKKSSLARIDTYDISWHRKIVDRSAAFNSIPQFYLPLENSDELICKEFSRFVGKCEGELLVLFERPFIFELSVQEPHAFIRSFNKAKGTKDIVVFCKLKNAVFEVQELEYEIKIFVSSDEN